MHLIGDYIEQLRVLARKLAEGKLGLSSREFFLTQLISNDDLALEALPSVTEGRPDAVTEEEIIESKGNWSRTKQVKRDGFVNRCIAIFAGEGVDIDMPDELQNLFYHKLTSVSLILFFVSILSIKSTDISIL